MEKKDHDAGPKEFTYWVYARLNYYGEVKASLYDTKMPEDGERVLLYSGTVTHTVPQYETLVPHFIKGLEVKKEAMIATATAAVAEVDAQIQSLLALEHTV